jgi:transcription elongation factor Elf1
MNLSTGFFCDGCKKDLSTPTCFYHSKKDAVELDFCIDCFKKLSIELDYFYRPHAIEHTKREWEKMQKEWNCISCKQYLGSATKWSMFNFLGVKTSKERSYHICDTCAENESLIPSLFVYIDTTRNLIEMKSGEICDFTNLPDNEHVRMHQSSNR